MKTPLRTIPDKPRPGDFGLSIITGAGGVAIRLAQAFIGDTTRYTHAWLVVDEDGTIIEAMPGGARLSHVDVFRGKDVYYHSPDLSDTQRRAIKLIGRQVLVGVGYSFVDYPALALAHFGVTPGWLRRYIANSNRLICSQLVDEALRLAGHHLFSDGRLPMDVTPGDLFWMALERDLARPV